MTYQKTAFALLLAIGLFVLPAVAAADCTSPNEPEATIEYFSADKTYKYCDGTNWIDMSGGCGTLGGLTDVVITSPADGVALIYENASGNWIDSGCDTTPNGFDFADSFDVTLDALESSNIIQITGINCAATVAISGDGSPKFRTCSDASCSTVLTNWTNSPGTISVNQYIQIQLTASSTALTTRTADVNIGSGSADWNVRTTGPKIVFVTSTSYKGSDVGSVILAHNACQSLAATAGFPGTFKAWIADTSSDDPESTFTQPTKDYALVNGTVIANGWSDLVDGTLDNAINRDENSTLVSAASVWTGSNENGSSAGHDCNGWSDSTGAYWGWRGRTDKTNFQWSRDNTQTCDSTTLRLFCFEQ